MVNIEIYSGVVSIWFWVSVGAGSLVRAQYLVQTLKVMKIKVMEVRI